MSTTDLERSTPADPDLKTYRGRTLEELLPKIRTELGPDAVVVRQRDGLMGGIGGFFQQQFVEVDARRGAPRIDVYDEPPSVADGFAELLAAAAATEAPMPAAEVAPAEAPAPAPAAAFAELLPDPLLPAVASPAEPAPAAKPRPRRKPAARKPAARKAPAKPRARRAPAPPIAPEHALAAALAAHGLGEELAGRLVADALVHELPFAPRGDARLAVRRALARRIPLVPPRRAAASAVAFVGAGGSGKTRCVAGLAAAYAQAASVPVICLTLAAEDGGAELTRLLVKSGVAVEPVATGAAARARIEQAPPGALVVLDTPAVSPGDPDGVKRLARELAAAGLDEVQLAVPATLSAGAAGELHERLAPLKPSGIALTHADATHHAGAVVELACTTRLPLAYVAGRDAFGPADPAAIAERLLP